MAGHPVPVSRPGHCQDDRDVCFFLLCSEPRAAAVAIAASKLPATKNVSGVSEDGEGFSPLEPFGPLGLWPEVVVDVPPVLGLELPGGFGPDGGEVPVGGVEPEEVLTGGLLVVVVTLVATEVPWEGARRDDPVTSTL